MNTFLLLAAGLAALVLGGELLVRGAVGLALRLRLSPLVIGATVVGFGTSAPELATSLDAAFAGAPGLALGNVVGSNIANILLILGVAAALSPMRVDRAALRRDGPAAALAALACAGAAWAGGFGRGVGAVFALALIAYLVLAVSQDRRAAAPELPAATPGWRGPAALTLAGLVAVVVGAGWLVDGAIDLARILGASETVIGLTVVAVGTSLPELAASIAAALRGRSDMALGNVLGSNVFNVFGILGVTALAHPLETPADLGALDLAAMLGATALLLLFATTGRRITRGEGFTLTALYAVYIGALVA